MLIPISANEREHRSTVVDRRFLLVEPFDVSLFSRGVAGGPDELEAAPESDWNVRSVSIQQYWYRYNNIGIGTTLYVFVVMFSESNGGWGAINSLKPYICSDLRLVPADTPSTL
jgi:hypothetical protein